MSVYAKRHKIRISFTDGPAYDVWVGLEEPPMTAPDTTKQRWWMRNLSGDRVLVVGTPLFIWRRCVNHGWQLLERWQPDQDEQESPNDHA